MAVPVTQKPAARASGLPPAPSALATALVLHAPGPAVSSVRQALMRPDISALCADLGLDLEAEIREAVKKRRL
jgi:hypothetical protein